MVRKLATILSALALLASAAATILLLSLQVYQGTVTEVTESGSVTFQTTKTLVGVNGYRAAYLLIGVTLASGIPLLAALFKPALQPVMTWVFGLILLAFAIAGSLSIGSAYLPGALLLVAAALLTRFIPRQTVQ